MITEHVTRSLLDILSCGKHMQYRIILLIWEVSAHITSLTPSLYIEVPVLSQENEGACICVVMVIMLPISTIIFY